MPAANPYKNDAAGNERRAKRQAALVLFAITAGALLLACVGPARLDGMPRLCLWYRLIGGPCPACGTTHALAALLRGQLAAAWTYNRNVVLLGPLLLAVWFRQLFILWRTCLVERAGN
jgi:hypothetical protein